MIQLIEKAKQIFPDNIEYRTYFSPGRVNLIGEHIDYNGGFVLPCALDIGTFGIASRRSDDLIFCYSDNFPEVGTISFSLADVHYDSKDNWVNYVKGVVSLLGLKQGFNLYVHGEIPNASGLSSSASLELLVGVVANDLYNLGLSKLDLVKIAHRAENEFIGVNCGIMDQFIIGMAENKSGILLNTASLEYHFVKIDLEDYVLVIGNTNKKRTLASSKYNERRSECERGLVTLKQKYQIKDLCELSMQEFSESESMIRDEVIKRRVRHVISENERTKKAYQALQDRDLKTFGLLLNASHLSLQEDYEVTGLELDTLQELFLKYGAIGARMTGAGFGGCMIALVKEKEAAAIIEKVSPEYMAITGLKADFYPVHVGNGAGRL